MAKAKTTDWFDVDKDGLAKLLEGRPRGFLLTELISNSWDENSKQVDVTTSYKRGVVTIEVRDDNPEGFHDLTHAWTLFAESRKKGDVGKRGRFNMGEKLVLALAQRATISTTKGTVSFGPQGRQSSPIKTQSGSIVTLEVKMTREEWRDALALLDTLLPPEGVDTTVNGSPLKRRQPALTFAEQLATEHAGDDGILRPTWRKATVELHEPTADEVPHIYEMGIPVCELDGDDRWHVNVLQKVPLNMNRDNVTPSYRKALRVHVLNHAHKLIKTEEEAAASWVKEAASDKRCSDDATGRVMDLRFGERRVAYDPSDPEANKRAVAAGYTLVTGGSLSKGEWENAKRAGAIEAAGKVTPSPKVLASLNGMDDAYPEDKVTDHMRRVLAYSAEVGAALLGKPITVRLSNRFEEGHAAWYGQSCLTFNVARLGKRWFTKALDDTDINALLIHELAHDKAPDHLSDAFHDACCLLGAKLAVLWRHRPEVLETTAADYSGSLSLPRLGGLPG